MDGQPPAVKQLFCLPNIEFRQKGEKKAFSVRSHNHLEATTLKLFIEWTKAFHTNLKYAF